MIKVTYTELSPFGFYSVRGCKVSNLQALENWLFSACEPEKLTFWQPTEPGKDTVQPDASPAEVRPIGMNADDIISINLIQNEQGDILFSTGTVKGTRPHISTEISKWLKHCEERRQQAIGDNGFRYVP